ncbi:hypothetical protein V8F06_012844 [Rhypophila decipiens]
MAGRRPHRVRRWGRYLQVFISLTSRPVGQLSVKVYDGKTLFDQFDYDVQSQILVFFEQSTGVLHQTLQVLTRLFGNRDSDSSKLLASSSDASSFSSISTAFTYQYPKAQQPNSQDSGHVSKLTPSLETKPPQGGLSVCLRQKWRIETILAEFSDLNARNLRKIQLWCLGAELSVDRGGHLLRLESDNLQYLSRMRKNDSGPRCSTDAGMLWSGVWREDSRS